jgi:hypothetical protein
VAEEEASRASVTADPRDVSLLEAGWRVCEWCKRPRIPPDARKDRITCSKACRQAKARFRVRRANLVATDRPMRFAYADPPYPEMSRKYYRDHPDFAGEVDHRELVDRLVAEYPDGWALSTSAAATRLVWELCPEGTRLAVWVNGPRKVKSYTALHAYESVLIYGGRPREAPVVADLCDALIYGGRQRSHPGALPGMKPAQFCEWVFQLLGATAGDQLDDLFPGSGAVARAWSLYAGAAVESDASAAANRDASSGSGADASPRGRRDTSARSPRDVGRDTSRGPEDD